MAKRFIASAISVLAALCAAACVPGVSTDEYTYLANTSPAETVAADIPATGLTPADILDPTQYTNPLYSDPSEAIPLEQVPNPPPRFTIAIDPGHQERGNYDREPIGPGASEHKAKVASGTRGTVSGVAEYQLVLDISLQLRDELLARGFDVVMIRETNDVNISNSERAIIATESGADIFIRVHANGSSNSDANGIMALSTSKDNPFIPNLYSQSRSLSDNMLASMVETTGARNLGVIEVDNMTGSNWSTAPVTIVEMGFMTNPAEDMLMQTDEYQAKLVLGMANGIERYFAEQNKEPTQQ